MFDQSGAEPGTGRQVFTVSQLNVLAGGMLRERFGDVWVEGEVSGFKRYPSGHLYFTLRDEDSQLSAVCFRHSAERLRFEPEEGLQLVVHGRLEIYAASGKYQLIVDQAEPKGVGALQQAFEQLKRKLDKEGLFAVERKRSLPGLPRVVGIVTSPAGAAIHDMLRTLRLHRAPVRVLLYPAQVQGVAAAEQIAEGIGVLSARDDIDAIIIGRGGGSIEDLWPFNEERVARAIVASRVPVISGVGHEVDFTIADFAADVRAATPTAAALLVARCWEDLAGRIDELASGLAQAGQERVARGLERVEELVSARGFELVAVRLAEAGRRVAQVGASLGTRAGARLAAARDRCAVATEALSRSNPVSRLMAFSDRLSWLSVRLPGAWREAMHIRHDAWRRWVERGERSSVAGLAATATRLEVAGGRLGALSPLASLGRGYSICRTPAGEVVRSVRQVRPGDELSVRVADGTIAAGVRAATTIDRDGTAGKE